MKRKITKLFTVLALLLSISTVTVYAAGGQEETGQETAAEEMPEISLSEIQPRSPFKPSTNNCYTNDTAHTVSGVADHSELYTNKCFHGVKKIWCSITNYESSGLTVRLYKYTINDVTWKIVDEHEIRGSSGGSHWTSSWYFDNLDTDTYYFLSFKAPSDFSGSVTGKTS